MVDAKTVQRKLEPRFSTSELHRFVRRRARLVELGQMVFDRFSDFGRIRSRRVGTSILGDTSHQFGWGVGVRVEVVPPEEDWHGVEPASKARVVVGILQDLGVKLTLEQVSGAFEVGFSERSQRRNRVYRFRRREPRRDLLATNNEARSCSQPYRDCEDTKYNGYPYGPVNLQLMPPNGSALTGVE
jgi:hypothetical protein